MRLTDAHLHLPGGLGTDIYPDAGALEGFVACTARPGEWDDVPDDPRAVRSYGVHPWHCSEWTPETKEKLELILDSDPDAQIGEIGLDSKRGNAAEQMPAFTEQLAMASERGLTASIHDIGCEDKVLEAVRTHGKGCRCIILHSYSSESYVKPFCSLGCMMSIGPRILSRSETRVRRLLGAIPPENLLLETDSPYVPEFFAGMEDFAGRIAPFAGMDADSLAETVRDNFRRAVRGRKHQHKDRNTGRKGRHRKAGERIGGTLRMRSRRRVRFRRARPRRIRPHPRGGQGRLFREQSQQADTGYARDHRDEKDRSGQKARPEHQSRHRDRNRGRSRIRRDRTRDSGRGFRSADRCDRHRKDEDMPAQSRLRIRDKDLLLDGCGTAHGRGGGPHSACHGDEGMPDSFPR